MDKIGRREFLRAAAATTGGVVIGGTFQGLLASAAGAAEPSRQLSPVTDQRDGVVRLWLPDGFEYRSFHDTEDPVTLDDGTRLPGRHDGMAAFPARDGNVWLVRNHEVNNPGPPFGPGTPYDTAGRGGTTTTLVTPRGKVISGFTSLNGTQMNCSGGSMPWGSWITCEETVNGPDVGPDFTTVSNVPLQQRHGFIFEVPAGGQSNRRPITSAGRFAHEAAVFDAGEGIVYLTEDNFAWPSGLYRYLPPTNPMDMGNLADGGRLQMLRVVGQANANLAERQTTGTTYGVDWVDIADPAPTFPYTPGVTAPTTNDAALTYVGNQGRAQGAAYFSRLEGATFTKNKVFFSSTQGGGPAETSLGPIADGYGNGSGQIWAYDTKAHSLTCVFQSPGPSVLDLPDNLTARSGRGSIVICEDNVNDNFVRGLTSDGQLFDIALNRLRSGTGTDRSNDEFAGATFSPDGGTLFVNIQASAGMSFAIWGPWGRLGV
jgi:secreted PhoX family phosphatase